MNSDKYIELYRDLHEGGEFLDAEGNRTSSTKLFDGSMFTRRLMKPIMQFTANMPSFSILDYGCGKARHWYDAVVEHPVRKGTHTTLPQILGPRLYLHQLYDPAVPRYSKPPIPAAFNVVGCADVMEHVPEKDVPYVLWRILYSCTEKPGLFFSISGNPAKKSFLHGENLHCTIKPMLWWQEKILQALDDFDRGDAYVYLAYDAGDKVCISELSYNWTAKNLTWQHR